MDSNSPTSVEKPRLDLNERHLSRFYEALVLLYTLGSTRGEYTDASISNNSDPLGISTQVFRRRFLDDLAYMCDYEKGGNCFIAIGLEFTPQKHVFWAAANKYPAMRVKPFLERLLDVLKDLSLTTGSSSLRSTNWGGDPSQSL